VAEAVAAMEAELADELTQLKSREVQLIEEAAAAGVNASQSTADLTAEVAACKAREDALTEQLTALKAREEGISKDSASSRVKTTELTDELTSAKVGPCRLTPG